MLTVADVLALPVLAAGGPRVRAGEDRLEVRVRWVHVSEQTEVAGLLGGGELLLSTGMGLRDVDLSAYVAGLVDAGAVGLVVELGDHLDVLPPALVRAARTARFPLVELHRVVRFVEVTEQVHARLLVDQHERLRFAERVHASFATLSTSGAATQEVLERAAELLEGPVVLEDVAHRAVAHVAGPAGTAQVLFDWSRRSRREGGHEGWSTAPVGAPGNHWGRLVAPGPGTGHDEVLVLERAAEVLTVLRLLSPEGDRDLADRAHADLVQDLLRARPVDEAALRQRVRALGLPTRGGFAAAAVHTPGGADRATVAQTLARVGGVGITGVLDHDVVGVLLVGREEATEGLLPRLAQALPDAATLGAAAVVGELSATAEGFAEARHVVQVAAAAPRRVPGSVHRTADLGVRGLLWRLRDDHRLAQFAESQLSPLLDAADGGAADLALLAAYLEVGGSMTPLAARLHLSRPATYGRVERLAQRLGRDLEDPETRVALHLALLTRAQNPWNPIAVKDG